MAVTEGQLIKRKDDGVATGLIASGKILYEGTMVFITTAGYLTDVIASGANRFFGIACRTFDNSGGGNGALAAECYTDGIHELVGSGFAQTQAGEDIYASDNYTITTTSSSMSFVGPCEYYVSSTVLGVRLLPLHTP